MSCESPAIAFDASVVRPPFTGVQNAVREQVTALLELWRPGEAAIITGDDGLARLAAERQAPVFACPPFKAGTAVRIAWQQLCLPRLLRQRQVSVLHAGAYTAPWRCPVPYLLNVHDVIAIDHPRLCSWRNAAHMRLLLPHSIKNAAVNLVSTHHGADRLRALWDIPSARIVVSPLGVDCERFSAPRSWPACLPFPEGEPYWLFVGNLEPKKGIDILLDAFARQPETPPARLVIAGRAAWKCGVVVDRIRAWTPPGRVVWLGPVAAEVLPALYQHAVAFVFPSLCEGFGLPVLEAMAAGTTVIHSDHPAVAEAAGGAGVSAPVGDADALAAAMRQVMASPTRRSELREQGQAHARQYTWRRWAETALPLLRQTAAGGG